MGGPFRRKRFTPFQRLKLFERHHGVCALCGLKIDGTKEKWEIDHGRALGLLGKDEEDNLFPVHAWCHKKKTADDQARIVKAKRQKAKFIGAYVPKRRWASRPLGHGRKQSAIDKTIFPRFLTPLEKAASEDDR
jgi:5-methylcytosine-specific restriction endonuclease McrA